MVVTPARWPAINAGARNGVNARRLRKPVWMSRARSVPAFMVANRAPCMKQTASAKGRNLWEGKPGKWVEAWRPAEFTASRAIGKISGG